MSTHSLIELSPGINKSICSSLNGCCQENSISYMDYNSNPSQCCWIKLIHKLMWSQYVLFGPSIWPINL